MAVSENEFDTLSLQLTSHFALVQGVKLAAHDHPMTCHTAPAQTELLSVGDTTTMSTEKTNSDKQFVLHLISVIDKSLTVVLFFAQIFTRRCVALWFGRDYGK